MKIRRIFTGTLFQSYVSSGWFSLILFAAIISLGAGPCDSPDLHMIDNDVCLACHDGRSASDVSLLPENPHFNLECEDCHGSGYLHVRNGGRGGLFIDSPSDYSQGEAHLLCKTCHKSQVEGYLQSRHAVSGSATCGDCHNAHGSDAVKMSYINNALCLECHADLGFDSDESIEAHTFHSVEPEVSGASRCTTCHMPPLQRYEQASGLHGHSLVTLQPITSNEAIEAGIEPTPPNSCAGITGCHDGTILSAPNFYVDNPVSNDIAQFFYENRYGTE